MTFDHKGRWRGGRYREPRTPPFRYSDAEAEEMRLESIAEDQQAEARGDFLTDEEQDEAADRYFE